MREEIIKAEELTRVFNGLRAVDRVTFSVREGEIFGFLGPNGAGKTTTINMLTTVLKPTSGRAEVCGHDVVREPERVRRSVGVVPQEYTADEDLTGYENVILCADLYGLPKEEGRRRALELLSLVQLEPFRDKRVETYSGGMRRRLELACGLINRPRVLFLDEPTLGLDVQTRASIWEHIRSLRERFGMTIFLTTHYLEEADFLCDRIAIMDHGRIVEEGSPSELKDSLGGDLLTLECEGNGVEEILRTVEGVREVKGEGGEYRVKVGRGETVAPLLLRMLTDRGVTVKRLSLTKPTLNEVYLERTGRSLRDQEESPEQGIRQRVTLRRART
jgi:ABC-2 type transport system ATP-binding protein